MDKVDRDNAIKLARKIIEAPFVVLDTETTGLREPLACSIALVNELGDVWKSLVKPSKQIEPGAIAVHKITNEMVEAAPALSDVKGDLVNFISKSPVVIYNAPFDTAVVKRDLPDFELGEVHDAMQIYAAFVGQWDDYHGNYRWHKLGAACAACGLKPDGELHGADVDAEMTRRLLIYIAGSKTSGELESA